MILRNTPDLGFIPKRIISLVPSQTELLFDMGLETETIGITKFCIHPATWFKEKTKVGGTKTLKINAIKELQPDLIIANKEENVKEQVEQLAKDHAVWVTDVNNLEDALLMIRDIGNLTARQQEAGSMAEEISRRFDELATNHKPIRTAYLIWRKPYMTVGGDTFINDMLGRCGLKNVFAGNSRYPEITISELQGIDCKLVLLSSEPYPFKQKHIDELSAALPGCKISLADGEMFSWYGSRLLQAPGYFRKLIDGLHMA